jgi:hypothetical protein
MTDNTDTPYICPLHNREVCLCSTSDITPATLLEQRAIGIWACVNGHREFGPPVLTGQRSFCNRCHDRLERIAVGIHPGWGTDGRLNPWPEPNTKTATRKNWRERDV